MREIHEQDRYQCSSRMIGQYIYHGIYMVYIYMCCLSKYIFVMMSMREAKRYTRIYARDQTADASKLECSWLCARASADFRRHSRNHQSSISVYWPQDDEFTMTRDSTHETKIDAMPGRCIIGTLCEISL